MEFEAFGLLTKETISEGGMGPASVAVARGRFLEKGLELNVES